MTLLSPRTDVVSAAEVRAVREGHGWTLEQMADAVEATPLEVAAWEAGTVRAPEKQAAWVHFLMAEERWNARVREARLPTCAWAQAHAPELHERILHHRADDWLINRADVRGHLHSCQACQSVWSFALRLRPPPAPPGDDFYTRGAGYRRWVSRFPAGMQPPLRLLGSLPGLAFSWLVVSTFPGTDSGMPATIMGVGIGLLLGRLAYLSVRDALDRRSPYVAGLLAGGAGITAGLLGWNLYDDALHLTDPAMLAGAGVAAVAVGLIAGARARRDAAAPAPLPAALAPSAAVPGLLSGQRPDLELDLARAASGPNPAGQSRPAPGANPPSVRISEG